MDWLSPSGRAVSYLAWPSERNAAAADRSGSSRRDLRPDNLAGALGVFFCFAVCGCTSGFARTDQIADRGLDRFCHVDRSNLA